MSPHNYDERFQHIQNEIVKKVRLRQPVNIQSYLHEIEGMIDQRERINKPLTKQNIEKYLRELGELGPPKFPKSFDDFTVPIIDV